MTASAVVPMPGRPLRVLHLDTGRDWRSPQHQLLLLADAQRQGGMEPIVAAPPTSALLRRARVAGLAAAAVRVRGPWDLDAARRLRRLLRYWRPDLVHAHDARAHAVALVALLGRATPLVVTRRTTRPVPTPLAPGIGARVARFLVPTVAGVAPLERAGVPADRVDVAPPLVAPVAPGAPRDWRGERGWPTDALVIGVVGAADAVEGALLAAALERLAATLGPAVAGRLRVVRFGGAASAVECLAGVPTARAGLVDDMAAALAGLDLLWHLPTRDRVGLVVLEAMALGVPAVALAVGGVETIVQDGHEVVLVHPPAGARLPVTALLVPEADPEDALPSVAQVGAALAEGAAPLLADPERRAALVGAGRAAAARFGVAAHAARVATCYAAALAPPTSTAPGSPAAR